MNYLRHQSTYNKFLFMLRALLYLKLNFVLLCTLLLLSTNAIAQPSYKLNKIKLPEEVSFYDNQFSSIQIYQNKLYLISESRLQDKAEAKIYVADISKYKKYLNDTNRVLPFSKYSIKNLDILRNKISAAGGEYEGIEATIIENGNVYFSIETETASPDCYIIKGVLQNQQVILDTTILIAMPKFTGADGKPIYNAGFEAMIKEGDYLFAFYEYNYFMSANYVRVLDKFSFGGNQCQHLFPMQRLPFRITDITATGNHHFTAINYFFQGGGRDAVYRPAENDSINNKLVKTDGNFKSYSRLVDIYINETGISWQPIREFPLAFRGYNWECIAYYKNGYFVMNDKYTTQKPYQSELYYLEKR